jgi:hypothetical protein
MILLLFFPFTYPGRYRKNLQKAERPAEAKERIMSRELLPAHVLQSQFS